MEDRSRVLVVGATGALGRPLVRRLVEHGVEVAGLTRHASKTQLLSDLGAGPVVADALDPAAISAAVVAARPEAVVHALTAIPKRGPLRARDLDRTNRLRREGTANLLAAARLAGARRFIAESMIFVYGFGDHGEERLSEDGADSSDDAKPWLAEAVASVRDLEAQVVSATMRGEVDGVLLRFGFFYGVGAGTDIMARLLCRRMLPVPGEGAGVGSWIHIEDAAAAVVAALAYGRPGEAYNIVDDEPVLYREFVRTLGRELGAPNPYWIPAWLGRLVAPLLMADLESRIPVSNAKAKRELQWSPQFPRTVRDSATSPSTWRAAARRGGLRQCAGIGETPAHDGRRTRSVPFGPPAAVLDLLSDAGERDRGRRCRAGGLPAVAHDVARRRRLPTLLPVHDGHKAMHRPAPLGRGGP
jgi:nucleoside-diphosphate-sugar epimerase